jgi:hypothetical protein
MAARVYRLTAGAIAGVVERRERVAERFDHQPRRGTMPAERRER